MSSIEMERINTRVSKEQADWLERESEIKGMSKSQLIMLAIEKYMRDTNELRLRMKVLEWEHLQKMDKERGPKNV